MSDADAVTTMRRLKNGARRWRLDLEKREDFWARGGTLVIDGVDGIDGPTAALAYSITVASGRIVQTNLYQSRSPLPGFGPHRDDHDAIALQLEGSKVWAFDDGEVLLQEGDAMYVPSGLVHNTSSPSFSSHLTIGLYGGMLVR